MKRAQVVAAVGIGYLLGRTKRMRLALMIAAAGAAGKVGVDPGESPRQEVERDASSPGLGKIVQSVRGELLNAVKSAVVTAASSRIESLSSRLQDDGGAGNRRGDGAEPDGAEPDEPGPDELEPDEAEDDEAEDEYEEEDLDDQDDYADEGPEPVGEAPPVRRRPAGRSRATTRSGRSSQGSSAQGRGQSRRSTTAPVRRARR